MSLKINLFKQIKELTTGTPKRAFVSSIIIALLIPTTIFATAQRWELRREAAETPPEATSEETDVSSQWVPVPVEEYKENLDSVINFAKSEKLGLEPGRDKLIGKANPTLKEKRLLERYNLLDNAIKTLEKVLDKTDKEEYIDPNGDGKIDYQEFNDKTARTSQAVYEVRHTLYGGDDTNLLTSGLVNMGDLINPTTKNNKIYVFVEGGIYENVLPYLKQYEWDVEGCEDYDLKVWLCNDCSHEQIRNELRSGYNNNSVAGTVFVGDLPSVWYLIDSTELFPIDLYYMDLDGVWSEGEGLGSSPFTNHTGNTEPEIFIGRMTPPVGTGQEEIDLIKHHFQKNHNYRTGIFHTREPGLQKKGLLYIDEALGQGDIDNQEGWLRNLYGNSFASMYNNAAEDPGDYRPLFSDVENYMFLFDKKYELLHITAHSNPWAHGFEIKGGWESIPSTHIRDYTPNFLFYNLLACSNARYSEPNYMAGWYVFQKSNFGLTAFGSTKAFGSYYTEYYYDQLNTNNFGISHKNWFSYAPLNPGYTYGMTLVGDPTLRIDTKCKPPILDADSDGISDFVDNCPNDYNPDQKDNNKDGMGDVCCEKTITKDVDASTMLVAEVPTNEVAFITFDFYDNGGKELFFVGAYAEQHGNSAVRYVPVRVGLLNDIRAYYPNYEGSVVVESHKEVDYAGRTVDGPCIKVRSGPVGEVCPTCPEAFLPADLDCDCRVSVVDIMKVAAIWNTRQGEARFNPDYDFDLDDKITIADIMYIAVKWNTKCP